MVVPGPDTQKIFTRDSHPDLFAHVSQATDNLTTALSKFTGLHKMLTTHYKTASALMELIEPVSQLDYTKYRTFIGILHLTRNGQDFNDIVNKLPTQSETFTKLIDTVWKNFFKNSPPPERQESVATGIIELSRAIYPLGVNIVDAERPMQGLSAEMKIAITLAADHKPDTLDTKAKGKLHLIPEDGQTRIATLKAGEEYDAECEASHPGVIKNGQSVIIGNKLSLHTLIDVPIKAGHIYAGQEGAVIILNGEPFKFWSRGGILLTRTDDQLRIFDRGSRSPLKVVHDADGLKSYTYRPEVPDSSSEDLTFGHTQI